MKVGGFSGSLWQGSLHQLSWRNIMLAKLNWQFTFSSWMPALEIELRDPQGLQGAGILRGWLDLQLHEWQLSVPADVVRQQLSLPLPITAQESCNCGCNKESSVPLVAGVLAVVSSTGSTHSWRLRWGR